MARKYQIFNSAKFSPNPWESCGKSFYTPTPSKNGFIPQKESHNLNKNMCRLSLLFPTIKINYILRILKIHHYNISEAIDMLLFIKSIQKQYRHQQRLTPLENFRKSTCARCVPMCSQPLTQQIIEEEAMEEERARTIFPNITFGDNCSNVYYEHNLNFSLPPAENSELYIANIVRPETPINEEIIQVDDPETPQAPRSSGKIKLRVLRKTSGHYISRLVH